MNVIETIKGELYKAVPHIPSRSYEKNVFYQRTDAEVAAYVDEQFQNCKDAGNKVHTWKQSKDWEDADREYYLKRFREDHRNVVGEETVHVTYPQSGWFVMTEKWSRMFPNEQVTQIWDERI